MAGRKTSLRRASREDKRMSGFGESPRQALVADAKAPWADTVIHALTVEADRDGLLDGEKSQHVTFRAPPALVEAAKRNLGVASTSELGMLALMMLAQPDPVAAVMKKNRGALGKDHTLEY